MTSLVAEWPDPALIRLDVDDGSALAWVLRGLHDREPVSRFANIATLEESMTDREVRPGVAEADVTVARTRRPDYAQAVREAAAIVEDHREHQPGCEDGWAPCRCLESGVAR